MRMFSMRLAEKLPNHAARHVRLTALVGRRRAAGYGRRFGRWGRSSKRPRNRFLPHRKCRFYAFCPRRPLPIFFSVLLRACRMPLLRQMLCEVVASPGVSIRGASPLADFSMPCKANLPNRILHTGAFGVCQSGMACAAKKERARPTATEIYPNRVVKLAGV